MVQAKEGDTVKVHYTGKLMDGIAFDSSVGADPVEFKIGSGRLIPGFEEAVIGMSPGESKIVEIPSEKAYGKYKEDRVVKVDLKDLPSDIEPRVGMELEVCGPKGDMIPVQITEIEGTTVTLDANHPLSEQDLTFEIQLIEIVA
jgi:peptidylprolyl isomerase